MKRCIKIWISVLLSLLSYISYAQQTNVNVTNDVCRLCSVSTNGVKCGRCGSAMIIEKETDNSNPVTHKTVYSYVLRCPTDNHVVSCNSNVRITSGKNNTEGKVYCPICKKEFNRYMNLYSLHIWKKCEQCKGTGKYEDGSICGYCKDWREIGKTGKRPAFVQDCIWRCYDCKPYRYFTFDLKEIRIKKFKGIEWTEDVVITR